MSKRVIVKHESDGCAAAGCLIMVLMLLGGCGLVGLAWKFTVWAWS